MILNNGKVQETKRKTLYHDVILLGALVKFGAKETRDDPEVAEKAGEWCAEQEAIMRGLLELHGMSHSAGVDAANRAGAMALRDWLGQVLEEP